MRTFFYAIVLIPEFELYARQLRTRCLQGLLMRNKLMKKRMDIPSENNMACVEYSGAKGRARAVLTAAVLILSVLMLGACQSEEDFTQLPSYLRSATYFADEWPINFWNSENDTLEADMAQIAADGFNSIILVVPWREFQPTIDPVTYCDYAFEKLDAVMEAARAQGLWVCLRVGYTWDYYDESEDVRERFRALMGDELTLAAWDDYVVTLYERASAHGNLFGGFITWEDTWNFTAYASALGNTEESRECAQYCGYTDYVGSHYTIDEVNRLYGEEFQSFSEMYMPASDQPAMALLYEFFDKWQMELLAHSQTLFPNLTMEVRMDADPVYDESGEMYWYSHRDTYSCGDATYVALMYGVPIGHLNQGEKLTASEALAKSEQMLDEVMEYTDGKLLYIEQFLYMDNTVGFEYNAQVKDDELAEYILDMADVLKGCSMGYGVWTYRDYANNQLYNSQFALGDAGWELTGGAKVTEHNGSEQAELPLEGCITSSVSCEGDDVFIRFTVDADEDTQLEVTLGGKTQAVTVGSGVTALELSCENGGEGLSITSDRLCYIDNVKIYNHIQEARLYTIDGEESDCISAIRRLNRKLR